MTGFSPVFIAFLPFTETPGRLLADLLETATTEGTR